MPFVSSSGAPIHAFAKTYTYRTPGTAIYGWLRMRIRSQSESASPRTFCSAESGRFQSGQTHDVVIVGAARTPFGSFRGSLSSFTAWELGAAAIKDLWWLTQLVGANALVFTRPYDLRFTDIGNGKGSGALLKAGVSPADVEEVILGNVLSAGLGQAPAKQAALAAGLPPSTVCFTVNKVCSSGMKAVMLAAQAIATGECQVAVAGGMESMSNAPHLLPRAALNPRFLGTGVDVGISLRDSLVADGLWDNRLNQHMGTVAERVAEELGISRNDQDEYAVESYGRAYAASQNGLFGAEIVGVEVGGKMVTQDEEVEKFDEDKLRDLEAAFSTDGTLTAGNSSGISDGAAALVLTSAEYAKARGIPVWARIRGWADAEQAPEKYATAPAVAIALALKKAGLGLEETEVFEINEAFSVVALANQRLLGLDGDDLNVNGGAVAVGHPIGASGTRLLMSLTNALATRNGRIGVAAICNGGGGASAVVLERSPEYGMKREDGKWRVEVGKRIEEGEGEGESVEIEERKR